MASLRLYIMALRGLKHDPSVSNHDNHSISQADGVSCLSLMRLPKHTVGGCLKDVKRDAGTKMDDYEAPAAKDINLINHRWRDKANTVWRVANPLTALMMIIYNTTTTGPALRAVPGRSQMRLASHLLALYLVAKANTSSSTSWFGQRDCDSRTSPNTTGLRETLYI